MFLTVILMCFAILPSILTQKTYTKILEEMIKADKDKIRHLAHELVVEANYKIHQIDDIRNQVSKMIGFEIGMIMGQIKEKYRSMLEIYRQTRNKYSGVSKIVMPSAEPRLPIHFLVRMEIVQGLETDIERMIHLLETIPAYKLEMSFLG